MSWTRNIEMENRIGTECVADCWRTPNGHIGLDLINTMVSVVILEA